MYRCENCGAEFETPKIIKESHPYGASYAYEEWYACPHCEDTDMIELHHCKDCYGWFAESELEDGLCEECWKEEYGDEDYEEE